MATHTKVSNCRFPSSRLRGGAGNDGTVLVIVMMVATLLLITLTAVLPSVYQEGRREREEELIFRGTQYGRAVALFHHQFNRYPSTTKELLQTNGMRFLRKEYLDPMDPKGKWRFIHVSASGVLLDSKNQPLGPSQNNPNPAGIGQNNSTNPSFGGNSSMGNSSMGGFSLGNSSMGGSSSMGPQGNLGGMGGGTGMNPAGGGPGQIGPTSSFFGDPNQVQGAYIAGVAATSHHESIKVWQKHQHYDEWEFLGIDMGIFGVQVGMPGGAAGATGLGQQNPSPGPGSPQGPFSSPTPPTSFGPSSN